MGIDEEVARLILEADTKGFPAAKQELDGLEKDVYDLADSYELADAAVLKNSTVLTSAAQIAGAEARALEHLGTVIDTTSAKQRAMTSAAAAGTKGIGSLQQQITAGSFAFQDFTATSGDLGAKLNSVSNNLPTLLVGLGGLGTVLAIGATAGIALYRSWDQITRAFEEKTPFPRATDDIAAMKRELDKAKEAMGKLEENSSLTSGELAKYNGLREKTATLEERIADAEERQANLKKLKGLKDSETDAQSKATAESLQKDLGGQQNAIATALAKVINADNQARRGELERAMQVAAERANQTTGVEQEKFLGLLRDARDQLAKIPTAEDRIAEATQIVADAFIKGDARGVRKLQDATIDRPDLFTPEQRKAINAGADAETPEKAKAREKKAREDAAEQKKAADQLVADLNKQGKEADAAQKKAEAAAKASAKIQADQRHAQVGRQVSGEDAGIKRGGYDLFAQRQLTQLQAQGGAYDRNGKLHQMTDEQMFEMVQRQVDAALKQNNPFMMGDQRRDLATKATAMGTQELQKFAGLSGELIANQALIANRIMQLDGMIAQLRTGARGVRRQLQAPGPDNLGAGKP